MAIQYDKRAHLPKDSSFTTESSGKLQVGTNCHLGWNLYVPKHKSSYNKGMVKGADSQDQPLNMDVCAS